MTARRSPTRIISDTPCSQYQAKHSRKHTQSCVFFFFLSFFFLFSGSGEAALCHDLLPVAAQQCPNRIFSDALCRRVHGRSHTLPGSGEAALGHDLHHVTAQQCPSRIFSDTLCRRSQAKHTRATLHDQARPRSVMIFFMAVPICAGDLTTVTPAASSALILSVAVPLPPEMIAPAWPMRRPGGAVRPASSRLSALRVSLYVAYD